MFLASNWDNVVYVVSQRMLIVNMCHKRLVCPLLTYKCIHDQRRMCAYFISLGAEWDFNNFSITQIAVLVSWSYVKLYMWQYRKRVTQVCWTIGVMVTRCRGFCSPLNGPPGLWGPLQSCSPAECAQHTLVQKFLLLLIELDEVAVHPFFSACWSPSGLQHDSLVCWSCIKTKLVEITFFPITQISIDDNEDDHIQYWLSVYTGDTSS